MALPVRTVAVFPTDLGLTVARLDALVKARQRRRAHELRDLAAAVALGMHDPAGIEKHIKDPGDGSQDPNWVHERWWGGGRDRRWHETG